MLFSSITRRWPRGCVRVWRARGRVSWGCARVRRERRRAAGREGQDDLGGPREPRRSRRPLAGAPTRKQGHKFTWTGGRPDKSIGIITRGPMILSGACSICGRSERKCQKIVQTHRPGSGGVFTSCFGPIVRRRAAQKTANLRGKAADLMRWNRGHGGGNVSPSRRAGAIVNKSRAEPRQVALAAHDDSPLEPGAEK